MKKINSMNMLRKKKKKKKSSRELIKAKDGEGLAKWLRGETKLNLQNNDIGDDDVVLLAEELANNDTLTWIDLRYNNMTDEGAKALATTLRANSTLTGIYLSGNKIGDEGVKALANALRTNSILTVIALRNNKIGDEGGKSLKEMLELNDTVTKIDLGYNKIDEEIVTSINTALAANESLFPKGLKWAFRMQDADAMANLLNTTSEIILYHGNIGDEDMNTLATALRSNSTVTEIDLRGNKISNDGVNALNDMFEFNDTAMKIDLTDNEIDDDVVSLIDAALAANQALRAAKKDPRLWAISYQQLLEVRDQAKLIFKEDYEHKSMRDINKEIIIPRCQRTRRSYALSINNDGLKTDVFVSHSWDQPFGHFVDIIEQVYRNKSTKPNLWICAFGLMQGNAEEIQAQLGAGETALSESPFVKALKGADNYLVVRNCKTDLCQRIWCVLEIMYAKEFGLIPHRTMVTGPDTFAYGNTSCEDADSYHPEDKKKILAELTGKNSVAEVDAYIKEFRAFGALGSDASEKTSTEEDTKRKITPAAKSEERTVDDLLSELAVKLKLSEDQEKEAFKYITDIRTSDASVDTASDKTSAREETEAVTTPAAESGEKTSIDLLSKVSAKMRHETAKEVLIIDDKKEVIEMVDSNEYVT